MNLKILLHIRCLVIIICGIINIGDTKNDVPTHSSTSHLHGGQMFTHQKGSTSHSSTKSPVQHHGNSYTMLSQAISHAVSHEFSECLFLFNISSEFFYALKQNSMSYIYYYYYVHIHFRWIRC